MPSIDGGDSLSPEYAPWAYIGSNFVWQTVQNAEHEGYLYRAGRTRDGRVVCERRPNEDVLSGSLRNSVAVEEVPEELIPEGLFPNLQTMSEILDAVKSLVDQIDASGASSDQLDATIRSRL